MAARKPPLTSQQSVALAVRNSSVSLSAGAGCGKTFVLTQRFLSHLEPSSTTDPLGGLVAITFTERAAREMRDRIRTACRDALRHCPSNQRSHWISILHGLDSARVSTIHSFCAGLLRAHAVDAGIDPRFRVLDRATGAAVLRDVISDRLHDLLDASDPDCMQMVLLFGVDKTREHLYASVSQRFRVDFQRFERTTTEQMKDFWKRRWEAEFVPQLLCNLVNGPEALAVLDVLRQHVPLNSQEERRRGFLLENLAATRDNESPVCRLKKLRAHTMLQSDGFKRKEFGSGWESGEVANQVQEALKGLRTVIDKVLKTIDVPLEDVDAAVSLSLIAMRLTHKVVAAYEDQKRVLGALDFDDLLFATRDLLRRSEDVRRRVAGGIRFLLVDEFQDTDPVQAEIVRSLCGNRLSRGKLFIVGDSKQSIYRFRRADPTVFEMLRQELPEEGRLALTTNFRSQPVILKFVNQLFTDVLGPRPEPLVPHVNEQLSPPPSVEFLFPRSNEENPKAEKLRALEADWIARRLSALFHDATPRVRCKNPRTDRLELRRVQPGDVVILFRALTSVAVYEEALRRYDLEYYLVGGRAFYAQQEVYDLINLCQFLSNPDDEIALAGVLRSPFFSLSDDTLMSLAENNGGLSAALEEPPSSELSGDQRRQVSYASAVLAELRCAKDRLPMAGLLRLAMERTGYDAALLNEHLGERKLANLGKLIDMARQFDREGSLAFHDFVSRLRDAVSEETDEELAATQSETSDVIRLMTIHQAKGLEFPVVIVADVDRANFNRPSTVYLHPELGALLSLPALFGRTRSNLGREMLKTNEDAEEKAETARLLYVATTRAADHLILSAAMKPRAASRSVWMKILTRAFDIETGQPASTPSNSRAAADDAVKILVHQEPPAAPAFGTHRARAPIPLAQFQDSVEQAEPAQLPTSLAVIAPTRTGRRRVTVSEIEAVDAAIRSGDGREAGAHRRMEEDVGPAVPADRSDSEILGTVVHSVLERIDFASPDAFEAILDSKVESLRGQSIRARARSQLRAFAGSSLAADLASAKSCFRELDFLLRWPNGAGRGDDVTIAGQIDCLAEWPDGAWSVFDYKTVRMPASGSVSLLLTEYEIQLGLYAMAARQLIGRLPDTVELVLLEGDVTRVPLAITEPFLDRLKARVNAAIREESSVQC